MIKLSNLDYSREIVFDNENYVLNEKDLGEADITLNTYKGSNQIGAKVISRTLESREISITGYILAENKNEMLEKKRNLQKVINPFEDFLLIIDNKFKIQVSANSSVRFAVASYENNDKLAKFLISGVCGNPCFTSISPSIVPIAYWKAGFKFPFSMSTNKKVVMGSKQPSKMRMIENKGDVETGMIIRIKALSDGIYLPYIMNYLTREKIQLNCTMAKGDLIEINTNYGEKSIIKNKSKDYFYRLDIDSDFLQLHIGENYLIYGAEKNENSLDIEIEFSPQFLEV